MILRFCYPLCVRPGKRVIKRLPVFSPVRLQLPWLEEENAHGQYAAIRGLPV